MIEQTNNQTRQITLKQRELTTQISKSFNNKIDTF